MCEVAVGVEEMTLAGFVWADGKPENVLIGSCPGGGMVKVSGGRRGSLRGQEDGAMPLGQGCEGRGRQQAISVGQVRPAIRHCDGIQWAEAEAC